MDAPTPPAAAFVTSVSLRKRGALLGHGAPIHLGDRQALLDHLAGLMAAYRNAGAAAADVVALDVLEQGDGAALATVRWVVRSADGAVVRDFPNLVSDAWS
jgi:hypothetical protein